MDEGVDPKQMCQSLVNKVAQSEQLAAVAEPEILILFEDWLEELEKEVIEKVTTTDIATADSLGRRDRPFSGRRDLFTDQAPPGG